MAISIGRPVAPFSTTVNGTTYSTASFTPPANTIVVVAVFATATVDPGFVAGFGVTWYKETSAALSGSTLYIFWGRVDANPQTDVITFTCPGDAASGCFILVLRYAGADMVTRNPIRQTIFNAATSTNATGTFTKNLDTNNGYEAMWASTLVAPASTPPPGWTEQMDADILTPSANFAGAIRAGGETGATITFTNVSTSWLFCGVEVYVDGAGPRPALAALGSG